MEWKKRWYLAGLVACLVVGYLLGPRIVNAATSLVTIKGEGTDDRAKVTHAGQLQSTEAAPTTFRAFRRFNVWQSEGCLTLFAAPGTRSFVLKQLVIDVYENPTPGATDYMRIYRGSDCFALQTILTFNPGGVDAYVVPIEPGFGIEAGGEISIEAVGDVKAEVFGFGYLVPMSDVPSTTKVSS